ncbi:Glycolysis [Elusimicrobium minutum Pei191]|uniref:Triosephosphate isomerase n=1 Tax=Elusimicrobium minutum (strain Pei191) TaxID=445932 RepID=B2KBM9_ELUMP|nr:triose-phosphate isomerase [Elusimicrobium minutum]ACC97716.1 Glycolysis [Elusimicrobium minutum Pei191]
MTKRIPFISGNWKMHNTIAESKALAKAIADCKENKNNADIMIAPSYTSLAAVAEAVKGSKVAVAAQDVHFEEKGAFTSAVAPSQIKDAGASHVIIGHSERRSLFGDTDAILNKKVAAALKHGLTVVFCVGETLAEREADKTLGVIESQLENGLKGFTAEQLSSMVVAYEPVWAIGTGKTATPEQAQEVHASTRKYLSSKYGEDFASKVRIVYGGSVKTDNVDAIMAQPDVDGALVGGQSLVAEQFIRIINFN